MAMLAWLLYKSGNELRGGYSMVRARRGILGR